MKKLAIIFLSVAFTGGVALACPHGEEKADHAPKTAEKAKTDKAKTPAKTPEKAKDTKTAKPAKQPEKKPEKVSSK